jgi:hypothetical protein
MDEAAADETIYQFYDMWKEVIDVCWEFYDRAVSEREREIARTLLTHQQFASLLTELAHNVSARHLKSSLDRIEECAIRASLIASETVYLNFDDFARKAMREPLDLIAQAVRTRVSNTKNAAQIVEAIS